MPVTSANGDGAVGVLSVKCEHKVQYCTAQGAESVGGHGYHQRC